MGLISKIKKTMRGDVPVTDIALEILRRAQVRSHEARERREMNAIAAAPARLSSEFARLSADDLVDYFRSRLIPRLRAVDHDLAHSQRRDFPDETADLIATADRIVDENTWAVGGFGPQKFDRENYWRCDPFTGQNWGLEYHADVPIYTPGGPDIRMLWEMNRFVHVLALSRAFVVTGDEKYAETFFRHVEEWADQNPYARGANYRSPMEVIMRAVNIVAAFDLVKGAGCCTSERVALVLKLADEACRFTVDNIEFSYIATGNHYITNLAGLFFVVTMLPELKDAGEWRRFALSELLRECEKQILPDGADYESSTGYHKFVAEMVMTCLLLAERNGIDVAAEHRERCKAMMWYLRAVIRPDGGMSLIGDCDGSQFLPIVIRDGDDAKYLLDIAAVMFDDAGFKIGEDCSPEVLWLLGKDGVERFRQMQISRPESAQFPNAGTYILRDDDLYVMLNANDTGINGRGSHSHNDALSIEVSALGHAWIVDPGSYVYNYDRGARHRFRSTAVHSTLMVDGREQNGIDVDTPFISSNDARPRLVEWDIGATEAVTCEQHGYAPILHRRTVELIHKERCWAITDDISGYGEHDFVFSFHAAPGLTVEKTNDRAILRHEGGDSLAIIPNFPSHLTVEDAGCATHYGDLTPTRIVRFSCASSAPFVARWLIIPLRSGENLDSRLANLPYLLQNNA